MPANFRRENRHQRVVGQRRHGIADLVGGKPRQIRGDVVNRRFPLPSGQRLSDIGQKLECLNEVFAAASHAQRHAMLEQQPLRRIVIHRFQPAKRAAVARMLHDDRHLAQFFEGALRREQLKFDFRLFGRSHGNAAPESLTTGCRAFNDISIGAAYECFMTMTRRIQRSKGISPRIEARIT